MILVSIVAAIVIVVVVAMLLRNAPKCCLSNYHSLSQGKDNGGEIGKAN
jgi:hypothetical protein